MWEKNDEQKRILPTQSQSLKTLAEAVLGGVLVCCVGSVPGGQARFHPDRPLPVSIVLGGIYGLCFVLL